MLKKLFKIFLLASILIGIIASNKTKTDNFRNSVATVENSFITFNRISLNIYPIGQIVAGIIDTNRFLYSSNRSLSSSTENILSK